MVVVEVMVLVAIVVAAIAEIAAAATVAPFSPGVSLLAPSATPRVSLLVFGAFLGVLAASEHAYLP